MAIDIRRLTRLTIGINTESGVEEYRFDMLPWLEEHPGLHTFQLNVTPPGGMPYKAETHMDGDVLVWPITASDTALPGDDGWYEIEAFGDDGLHKLSPKRSLAVMERMVGDLSDAPQTIQNWVEEANEALEDNRAATLAAEESAAAAGKAAEEAEKAIDATEKATEKAEAATAAAEAVIKGAVVRNLLDNSDFSIWQRGETFEDSIASTYWADRWFGSGNLLRSYAKTDHGCRITAKTNGTYIGIQQRIPTSRLSPGVYTVVWYFTPSADCKTYQGTVAHAGAQTVEVIRTNVTDADVSQGSIAANFGVMCLADNSSLPIGFSFEIHHAALYEGAYTIDTLPAYQPKGYAAELAECQRYYLPLMGEPLGFGYINTAGTAAYINVPIPQQMRIMPSLPENRTFYVRGGDSKQFVTTEYNLNSMSANSVRIILPTEGIAANTTCSAFGYELYLSADM